LYQPAPEPEPFHILPNLPPELRKAVLSPSSSVLSSRENQLQTVGSCLGLIEMRKRKPVK
jgi:hypothetical protein